MHPARFALLLLLCLLLPLQGLAQTSTPEEEPASAVPPPPLVPAPAQPQAPADSPQADPGEEGQGEIIPREWQAEGDSSPTIPRLLVEFLGGSLGATLGVIPGGVLFFSAFCLSSSCSEESDTAAMFGVGLAFTGAVLGAGFGINVGGDFMGGHGGFWSAAAGVALGTFAGLGIGGALVAGAGDAGFIVMLLSPIIGGIVGYELSNTPPLTQQRASRAPRPQVVPLVSTTPGGGLMGGLAGRF